ncbi:MAG: bifunctional phosphopantothenoylcysteine decarboxylase/phosphopantothenate--cysteine ligase CoaBC [Lachnospiraceae bacterium]|nr:bifunctional phosphopantothenoylcysteine decarboxylase/phosphopantothenate--cysteine ligase CoaBC [Lachnospiraceae bacterium]
MLKGKTVLLGVSGSIAAYKIANLARLLKKQHAMVHVLMTQNATNFITPTTFETLTGTKCLIDTFDRNFEFSVEHVALAKQADLFMLAPASANVIGKIAHGIADDMLTTTIMACPCKKFIAPAMNTNMYNNPIVQDNLARLKGFGYAFVEPVVGMLANGDTGNGKMADEETLLAYILRELAFEKDLAGKKVLVTAGPTREAIDPVRYLSNHSTGKMGYALARAAMQRGAEVTLVTGPTSLKRPEFVKVVEITTAAELYEAVTAVSEEQDMIIKAAAVADYRPVTVSEEKVKKGTGQMSIPLCRTEDTLKALGERKRKEQFLCGFSMETEHMLEHSREKLIKKNLDMIVANNVKVEGAGFGTDTNVVTILTRDGEQELPKMSKEEVAHRILDTIVCQNAAGDRVLDKSRSKDEADS